MARIIHLGYATIKGEIEEDFLEQRVEWKRKLKDKNKITKNSEFWSESFRNKIWNKDSKQNNKIVIGGCKK